MSGSVIALVAGTVLAVGALAFVLYPLFFGVTERAEPRVEPAAMPDDSAIRALREIEFDRATGKLSDADYAELRRTYGEQAIAEMRGATSDAAAAEADPIEARVRAYRAARKECTSCGLRPEPDAIYCSTCGGYLDRCPGCAAAIEEPGAAFCPACGCGLAARPAGLFA